MKSEENVSDEAVVDSEENVSDEAVVDSEENVSDEKEDYESSIDVGNMAGVGPATKQKLRRAGIMNIMDLLVHNTNFLLDAIGGSKDKVEQLQDDARQKLTDLDILQKDFISADKLLEKRKEISFISTYSSNLDDLLLGGIETQAVTEFYGEFGAGKTQICHSLTVSVQRPEEEGGLNAPAIYLDTEKTFRPGRIVEIAKSRDLDPVSILKNIHVARAMNTSHLLLLVKNLGQKIKETGAKLVVLDSAIGPFRAEYVGRGQLAERQQLLNVMMHDITRIAEIYNVAFVLTNQVMSQPDMFFGDPTKPIGGHVVAHATTYRIYLRKSKADTRVAIIKDSPHHPPSEAVYKISEYGVSNPE